MNTTRSKNNRLLSFFLCCIMLCTMPSVTKANVSISPMTENIEQASVPNYIAQAEAGVKKFYPQYVEYFKPIFTRTYKLSTSSQNIINTKVQENFEYFDEELPTEKDRVTTILLVLEEIIAWQDRLAQEIKWSVKGRDLLEIAEEIWDEANRQAKAETAKAKAETAKNEAETAIIKERNDKLEEIINIMETSTKNISSTQNVLSKIEEFFVLFKVNEIKKDKWLQTTIECYIEFSKQINRTPSKLWQEFINEYNKIKKQ